MNYNELKFWLGKHPNVVIAGMICLVALILGSLYLGADLSFIPAILKHLFGVA